MICYGSYGTGGIGHDWSRYVALAIVGATWEYRDLKNPRSKSGTSCSCRRCSQLAALLEDELFELQEVGGDLGNLVEQRRCESNMHRPRIIHLGE